MSNADSSATIARMKRHWIDDLIRSTEQALMVIMVACFSLGVLGTFLQLLLQGYLGEPSGPDY